MKRRRGAFFLAALSFLCGTFIALYNPGPFVRGTLGDVLVTFFLYFLIQTLRPAPPGKTAVAVFLFACLVEGMQALGISSWLGLARGSAAEVIVGSTFDWLDCIAYAAGAGAAYAADCVRVRDQD